MNMPLAAFSNSPKPQADVKLRKPFRSPSVINSHSLGLFNFGRLAGRYFPSSLHSQLHGKPAAMSMNSSNPMADGLRIQAAAIAAQQAALFEREARLLERQEALAQQEKQISAALEEKRHIIETLHAQLGDAREHLRHQRKEAVKLRRNAELEKGQATELRERLQALHGRFVRRFKRHWSAESKAWQRRQVDLERREVQVRGDAARLRREREILDQSRKRFHGDAEIEKRRLQEERQLLADENRRQRERGEQAEAELATRNQKLDKQRSELIAKEQHWAAERQGLEQHCVALRAEILGLEHRIANARRRLWEQVQQPNSPALNPVTQPGSVKPCLPELPAAVEAAFALRDEYQRKRQSDLERQAAALLDQRLHLAELYERLAEAEQEWHVRQADSAAELEMLAKELNEQEDTLRERGRDINAVSERLRQERDFLQRRRRELERDLTDLNARRTLWQAEHDRISSELEERATAIERREKALPELFRRLRLRRTQELDQLRRTIQASLKTRQQCEGQREDFHLRSQALRQAQEAMGEQALALEAARQELIQQSKRPEQGRKRLEHWRRRAEGTLAAARRDLNRRQAAVEAEEKRLSAEFHRLQLQMEESLRREHELTSAQAELEQRAILVSVRQRGMEQREAKWQQQRQTYEKQLNGLQSEIERLARLLIECDDGPDVLASAA